MNPPNKNITLPLVAPPPPKKKKKKPDAVTALAVHLKSLFQKPDKSTFGTSEKNRFL